MNEIKNSTGKRKWLGIGAGVIVVTVAAILLSRGLEGRRSATGQDDAATGEIVTAFVGDLSFSATATGRVRAQQEAQLALSRSGEVAEIFVKIGDTVQSGAPLLRLESEALERAVESVRQDLIIQEANLSTLLAPPGTEELLAAQAAVTSAQAQLDDLMNGTSPDDIDASEANLRAARANVTAAAEQLQLATGGADEAEIAAAQGELVAALGEQETMQELYDNLLRCFNFELPTGEVREFCPGLGNPEEQTRYNLATVNANAAAAQARLDALLAGPDANAVAIAQAGVAAAEAQLKATQANHALLLRGASHAQIAVAESQLAQARASLQMLMEGPSEEQVTMAEVAVELTRINLQRAQNNLERATLTAPFDGVITAINVSEGEVAAGPLAELVANDSLEVVLDVDEVDIGGLAVGQASAITLETWPGETIAGQIASITPVASSAPGALVTYEVYVTLGETELPVLVGMTANASLLTEERENVLLVANAAINADRNAGTYSVNRVTVDSQGRQVIEEVMVSVGLRDRTFTEITNGIEEGDQLLVGNTLPVFDFGSNQGPPPGVEQGGPGFGG